MRIAIFVWLFLCSFYRTLYAQDIEFALESNELGNDGIFVIKLVSNLSKTSMYRVRPFTSAGTIFIKDSYGNWINNNSTWTQLPLLSEEIYLKLLTSNINETFIYLVLQNIHTGTLIKSSQFTLYNAEFKSHLINEINSSIFGTTLSSTTSNTVSYKKTDTDTTTLNTNLRWNTTIPFTGIVISLLCIYAIYKAKTEDKW